LPEPSWIATTTLATLVVASLESPARLAGSVEAL